MFESYSFAFSDLVCDHDKAFLLLFNKQINCHRRNAAVWIKWVDLSQLSSNNLATRIQLGLETKEVNIEDCNDILTFNQVLVTLLQSLITLRTQNVYDFIVLSLWIRKDKSYSARDKHNLRIDSLNDAVILVKLPVFYIWWCKLLNIFKVVIGPSFVLLGKNSIDWKLVNKDRLAIFPSEGDSSSLGSIFYKNWVVLRRVSQTTSVCNKIITDSFSVWLHCLSFN